MTGGLKIELEVEAIGPVRKVVPEDHPERKTLLLATKGGDVARVVFGEVGRVFFGELRGYFPVAALMKVLQRDEIKVGDRLAWRLINPSRPVGRTPRLTESVVSDAVKRIGPAATQQAVARQLEVTEQGLSKWRARHGLRSWQEVLSKYAA
jgi:hypothetical protein